MVGKAIDLCGLAYGYGLMVRKYWQGSCWRRGKKDDACCVCSEEAWIAVP